MFLYHSKIADPALLEKVLFGRRDTADWLEKIALIFAETGHATHSLLIGNRGMGKSHLISVLFHRLMRAEIVQKNVVIADLEEDPYGIADYLDLLRHIIKAIARMEQNAFAKKSLQDAHQTLIGTEPKMRVHTAERILTDYLNGRRMLLLVENLNDIFAALGETGQSRWRDFLQTHDNTMICATSQAIFSDVQSRERPFFGFFHLTYLQKLDFTEARDLLIVMATEKHNTDLIAYLDTPEGEGKLRAIFELTEGNHRLLVTFYDFFMSEFRSELSRTFLRTIDQMKPYYESFLKLLPPQQQKIVQFLVVERIPQPGKTIADNCFLPATTVSKQMSELQRLGYVSSTRQGRDAYYEITEPMLRMCLESNENTDGILSIFVDFLGNLYSSRDLKITFLQLNLSAESADPELRPKIADEAYFYSKAFPKYAKGWYASEDELQYLRRLPEAERETGIRRLVEDSDIGDLDSIEFGKLLKNKQFREAESMLNKVFPDRLSYYYWYVLGVLLNEENRLTEAKVAYRKTLELKPNNYNAWKDLSHLLIKQMQYEEARKAQEQYLMHCPDSNEKWSLHFVLCILLGDVNWATLSFEKYEEDESEAFLMFVLNMLFIVDNKTAITTILKHNSFQSFLKRNKKISWPNTLQFTTSLLLIVETISTQRLYDFHAVLTSLYGKKKAFTYPLKFLYIGIRHIKENDPKALLELTLEERRAFEEYLPIGLKQEQKT
jgi:tetratricopeptide (TPR) repeat protein